MLGLGEKIVNDLGILGLGLELGLGSGSTPGTSFLTSTVGPWCACGQGQPQVQVDIRP